MKNSIRPFKMLPFYQMKISQNFLNISEIFGIDSRLNDDKSTPPRVLGVQVQVFALEFEASIKKFPTHSLTLLI